jgi:hypothetical protein
LHIAAGEKRYGAVMRPMMQPREAGPADATVRAFIAAATAFLVAAIAVVVLHAIEPVTRGAWLVAYLALVGSTSQVLLGPGLAALAHRAGAPAPSRRSSWARFALWNAGAIAVAVADLAEAPGGVLAGSIALLAALASFATAWRRIRAGARRPAPRWHTAYAVLLAGLVVSTLIGTGLADALPGQ